MRMKILVVLEFDVPHENVIPDLLTKINPPKLPYFTGIARVVPPPYSKQLADWLDEEKEDE